MDWYLDGTNPGAVVDLRHQIAAYLARHADPASDVDGATVVVSELLGNVVRHANGPAWVSLTWAAEHPVLEVSDLGPGFAPAPRPGAPADPMAESGRGLFIASAVAADLQVAVRRNQGAVVTAVLPVRRTVDEVVVPPQRRNETLPLAEEAGPHGFGKEAFLRALVVQLAEAVEMHEGPVAGARAVTQVGVDVGGRMEEDYRAALGVVGRMTPQQIADCLVRLKSAIGGTFRVVEVSDEQIVLTNEHCPFGNVVQRAPSLCRMTSSVFGGIAARNSDGASVMLEERIAVGDPGCRVVIRLNTPEPEGRGHHYPAPA
ncbi:MAG TPA: ATP-binding protein [Frankiaceae bacterium]|nr:ATP-binding protein [Frankiaceae bacterium]